MSKQQLDYRRRLGAGAKIRQGSIIVAAVIAGGIRVGRRHA
jgi:hypothetical protein